MAELTCLRFLISVELRIMLPEQYRAGPFVIRSLYPIGAELLNHAGSSSKLSEVTAPVQIIALAKRIG
jgi:hypothetical protein